jgi:predicted MFS family arabinose efflux permease
MSDDLALVPLHKNRAFLTFWGLGALNSTGRWLETLVFAIFVFDQTGSPFLVASMLMLRLLPMAMFGIFGGIIADRLNRYTILRIASALVAVVALILYGLSSNGLLEVWHIGLASFISGLVWSTDFPVRRTLMSDLAGPSRVSRAMSLDILAGSVTRTLGPLLGGVLYQQVGIEGAFLLGGFLYTCGWILIAMTKRQTETPCSEQRSVLEDIRHGLSILRDHEFLPGLLVVTIIFNVWGYPFISMVPVIAKDFLDLSDGATGFLTSAEGAGALLGAIALSILAKSEHARYFYTLSVLAYCLFAFTFSLSTVLWLSAALLVIVGFVSAAFGAMQSTLVLLNSPTGYQRQMMGVLSVCIGTAPIGFLHIGFLADQFGATTACSITAIEGTLAMIIAIWRWPSLLRRQPTHQESIG